MRLYSTKSAYIIDHKTKLGYVSSKIELLSEVLQAIMPVVQQVKKSKSSVGYFRSLAFRISLIAGTCYLVLCVLLTAISYQEQKNQVMEELMALESMFHSPLMLELDEIDKSKTELKKNPMAYTS